MNVKRKRRSINNGLVDTDDVLIECGPDYVNWIPIARKKIKVTRTNISWANSLIISIYILHRKERSGY